MKVLYIAGPYDDRQDPIHGVQENITRASRIALEYWRQGWAVICPHMNTAGFHHAKDVQRETWIEGDIEILSRCDAILMIPGWARSPGAKAERDYALEHGIEVIYYPNQPPRRSRGRGLDDLPKTQDIMRLTAAARLMRNAERLDKR